MKPKVINWMISGKCNMYCKFCYGRFDTFEMSKEKKMIILERIANNNVPKLTLTGGEPLLDNDIVQVLKKAHDKDIFTSLHTNGLLLDKDFINEISGLVGRVSLPLDGPTNKSNYEMRGERKYFSKIIGLTKKITKEDVSISIKTVATKKNVDDIEKMLPIISDIEPVVWLITEFVPLRRGKAYKEDFELEAGRFEGLKQQLADTQLNISFFSKNDLASHPHFFIDCKGEVYTNGPKKEFYIGNIFSEKIARLWEQIKDINETTQNYFSHSKIFPNESNQE